MDKQYKRGDRIDCSHRTFNTRYIGTIMRVHVHYGELHYTLYVAGKGNVEIEASAYSIKPVHQIDHI